MLEVSEYFFQIVIALVVLVTTGFTFYVLYVYRQWEKHFSGHRVQRENDLCPSNKVQPDVKHFRENKERVMNNSKYTDM